MPSTTVRINPRTHQLLRHLADKSGQTMQTVLDNALQIYSEHNFWDDVERSYAQLKTKPDQWQAELDERKQWEAALLDGLGGDQ